MEKLPFADRKDAGEKLSRVLLKFKKDHPVIIALPRGGVPVGFEIAKVLHAPLEIIISRKISIPGHKELGIGAVSEGGVVILYKQMIEALHIPQEIIAEEITKEKKEIDRRKILYKILQGNIKVSKKVVVLVDDGAATGVTAQAAVNSLKKKHPKKIIFASPVCSSSSFRKLKVLTDDIYCLSIQERFVSVGSFYIHFEQVTDQEVVHLMKMNKEEVIKKFPAGRHSPASRG